MDAAPVVATAIAPRTRLLLDGPILSTLLRLALPNIVVVMVQALSSAVDAAYLGRLGPDVLAGIALVFPIWMLMLTMSAGGVGGGISSSVARALGAGRRADADLLVSHALALNVGLAALFTTAVLILGPSVYEWMGGRGAALDAAVAYSSVVFGGALAVWLLNALASLLRGAGEMVVPAVVIVLGEVVHIALAPVLIFGPGPLPALGVTGAALSLITSYALRGLALGAYLLAGRAAVRLPTTPLRLHAGPLWDILRVGLPGSINTILTNLNVMSVTSLVGGAGVLALAGFGLAARLEYLQIPIVFGFGSALVTMVGTNVGAGQIERARRVAWVGALAAAAVTGAVGILAALVPRAWLGLFTDEPGVLAVGELYLRIVGPTFALFGFGLALYFAAQGGGRLLLPLLAGVARLLVVVGGGWFVSVWLGAGLAWLFATIAVAFAVFAVAQALAIRFAIRSR